MPRSSRVLFRVAACITVIACAPPAATAQSDGFGSGTFDDAAGAEPLTEPAEAAPSETTLTQAGSRPSRVEVQQYLDLQERYARNLTQPELATKAVALQQAVRNQEVAARVTQLEEAVRELLGDAINTPSEQTVTDLMKVLEARYSVPRGQQVYFEKKYRPAPNRSAGATSVPTPQPTTRGYAPSTPAAPSYTPPQTFSPTRTVPRTTYPQSFQSPTYQSPAYPAPTWQSQPTPQPYGF